MTLDERTLVIREFFWKKGLGVILEKTFDNDVDQALTVAFPELHSEIILAEGVSGLSNDWEESQDSPKFHLNPDELTKDLTEIEKLLIWKIEQFYPRGNVWIGVKGSKEEEQTEEEYYFMYQNYNSSVFDTLDIEVNLRKQGGAKTAHWSVDFSPKDLNSKGVAFLITEIVKQHNNEIKNLTNMFSAR